jgi:urease accessory protein
MIDKFARVHLTDAALQRAVGAARVVMGADGATPRLRKLHQQGCAKVILPRVYTATPEAVFINTSGGLTGGDQLTFSAEVEPGARLTCTTQAAERIYKSDGGAAKVQTVLSLGQGARLEWLPQETIMFNSSELHRTLEADIAHDATLVLSEMVVLGRHAMGETNISARINDSRKLRRNGRVDVLDVFRAVLPLTELANGALLGGARAFASVIALAPDLDRWKTTMPEFDGVEAAVSVWNGKLMARFLAHHPQALRYALTLYLTQIRGTAMPRVWALDPQAIERAA